MSNSQPLNTTAEYTGRVCEQCIVLPQVDYHGWMMYVVQVFSGKPAICLYEALHL